MLHLIMLWCIWQLLLLCTFRSIAGFAPKPAFKVKDSPNPAAAVATAAIKAKGSGATGSSHVVDAGNINGTHILHGSASTLATATNTTTPDTTTTTTGRQPALRAAEKRRMSALFLSQWLTSTNFQVVQPAYNYSMQFAPSDLIDAGLCVNTSRYADSQIQQQQDDNPAVISGGIDKTKGNDDDFYERFRYLFPFFLNVLYSNCNDF